MFAAQLRLAGEMYHAGVPIMAGTDTGAAPAQYTGFSLHDELALLVRAGLPPIDALRAATLEPARFLGVEDRAGTVDRGKSADLVVLDANPLENIHNTRRIDSVVVRGRLIDHTERQRLLAEAEHNAANMPADTAANAAMASCPCHTPARTANP